MVEVVFVVDEGDTARIVPIKTGIASDTDIEILTALEEGKKIVSGPYRILATKIRNGDKIKEEKAKKEENQQKRD
jgi:HlyD family secretion protein